MSILDKILNSPEGFITFKDEDEYILLSKQFMEELENNKYCCKKYADKDIEEGIESTVEYYSKIGDNKKFSFVNNKLITCEFFYKGAPDNKTNKNYGRETRFIDGNWCDRPAYIEYFDNGQLQGVGFYINGVQTRKDITKPSWKSFNSKGELSIEAFYVNGQLHNENGYARIHYVFNEIDDINSYYYLNGEKLTKNQWEKQRFKKTPLTEDMYEKHICPYCRSTSSTKYRLQDHIKICGGKKLLDSNKELNFFYECKEYHKQIFDFLAKLALEKRDYELLKLMKENEV